MVKVRDEYPTLADGTIDLDKWVLRISNDKSEQEISKLSHACQLAKECLQHTKTKYGTNAFLQGLEITEILNNLNVDISTLICGMFASFYQSENLSLDIIKDNFGEDVTKLLKGVHDLEIMHNGSSIDSKDARASQNVVNLKNMLLAVVEDIRVVLVKLAKHVCRMRHGVNLADSVKKLLALEAKEIYAPIANRLGIGHIKWELEDFSFRFLEPTIYKNIAKLLDEKRLDREKYIDRVISELESALSRQNINGEFSGRAKHIYSIWRKMKRKMVGYHEIYDIRAIRVIVPEIVDCYTALGTVHTLWQHIPQEFDDYIANPKANGYQSLHTAVVGPDGKVIEIQIRTKSMHELAELGVAAHWKYKEGEINNRNFENKINSFREILNWQNQLESDDVADAIKTEFFEDRVYVFTPEGDVVDLPNGATAIDFAYHIHSEVGDRCRGAKSNGKMIPLSQPLVSGAKVEILTSRDGGPSRDWLNPHLNYIATSKARAKIQQWFKKQDRDLNISNGRETLNRELKRLAIDSINYKDIASQIANCDNEEDLLAGLGNGDIKISQILGALNRIYKNKSISEDDLPIKEFRPVKKREAEITVAGVGDLLCKMAKCCKPIPGDDIIGYITVGEGVSIHRKDCINILHAREQKLNRLIEVAWGSTIRNNYAVKVVIEAYNRRGLLRDITSIIATEHIDIVDMNTATNKGDHVARFTLNLEVGGLDILGKILAKIQTIPNVLDVYRVNS